MPSAASAASSPFDRDLPVDPWLMRRCLAVLAGAYDEPLFEMDALPDWADLFDG